jgi:hypothetical protein
MNSVPVPDDAVAVIVVVPCPAISAAPVLALVKAMAPGSLELQVAETAVPFTNAVYCIVVLTGVVDRL